jgi:periplasmic protein TonB
MKRNNEPTPQFDEIIFGNRNKSYGAYDLRKRYKSTLSLSILFGVAFCAIILIALTFLPEEGIASTSPKSIVIIMADPLVPDILPPATIKPPAEAVSLKYLEPVVTENASEVTPYIPPTEELNKVVQNGNVNDTVVYVEPTDPVLLPEPEPRIFVEEMPEFPGGNSALLRYVSENLRYPDEALENNIQGRVTLKFVVNTNGSVDRIVVIRGVDPSIDNEAVRIINTLPHFKPGRQNGVPVPVWFTIPVVFQIKTN